jgi:hypothetical protein
MPSQHLNPNTVKHKGRISSLRCCSSADTGVHVSLENSHNRSIKNITRIILCLFLDYLRKLRAV